MTTTMQFGAPPHIGAILEGTHQTLEAIFGTPPEFGPIRIQHNAQAVASEVNVLVGFTGGLSGQIMLGLTREAIRAMASLLLMEERPEFDEVTRSTLAEVGNMVAGGCCTALEGRGITTNITVPSIIAGERIELSWPNLFLQKMTIRLPFGEMELTIGTRLATAK